MRCIFCKKVSDHSKSVEHLVPESLGNTTHVLPRGAVCDRCNNYFARKVEGPLLAHVSFRNLRAWYQVPTKRGVRPSLYGFIAGTDIDVGVRVGAGGQLEIKPERGRNQSRLEEHLRQAHAGAASSAYIFPRDFDPPVREMSRFMAKMALEAVALRFSRDPLLIEKLVDEPYYDPIRAWARSGDSPVAWPIHHRRIFPEEALMAHPTTGEWVQAGFGYDLFLTKRRETYFAFCLYGYEFVINVGGPSIQGYQEWLADHEQCSPLIERVGLRLERPANGTEEVLIVGQADASVGANFDFRLLGWDGKAVQE